MRGYMTFQLALVTGATSGIGEALCHLLAEKGINILATGRNTERLSHLRDALKSKVQVVTHVCDLGKPEERSTLISLIHEHTPDLVINNAGSGLHGQALAFETSAQMDILELNGNAVLELSLESARALVSKERKGVIMNVSSVAAFFPFPNLSVYAASKTFVNAFSESFDWEMRDYGIRVLASCPGVVATRFRERANPGILSHQNNPMDVMTVEFAAEEIWNQIISQKPVRIFDWRYRMSQFFSLVCPNWFLKSLLKKRMNNRSKPKDIIKLP
ncbi:MAG: short-subunit dehydrogenase [Chlamydiales bacterium]|jgi:short-subunit dehydrogenase